MQQRPDLYAYPRELPTRYLSLLRPMVRFARWDLSSIDLVDPNTGTILCVLMPVDKRQNADRRRRVIRPTQQPESSDFESDSGIAPHLSKRMEDYAATGLPPAYLHHDNDNVNSENDSDKVKPNQNAKEPR